MRRSAWLDQPQKMDLLKEPQLNFSRVIFHLRGFECHGKIIREGKVENSDPSSSSSSQFLRLEIPCGQKCAISSSSLIDEKDFTPMMTMFRDNLFDGAELNMTLEKNATLLTFPLVLCLETKTTDFSSLKITFQAKGPWGEDTRWASQPISQELWNRFFVNREKKQIRVPRSSEKKTG